MEAEAALGLYIIISVVMSIIVNIIFYRAVFKKPARKKANLYTWLSSLGIILVINIVLIFPFTSGVSVDSLGGGIAFGLLMPLVIAPIFWFVPSTIFVILRAIIIAITKKERDVMTEDIEEAELISTDNGKILN